MLGALPVVADFCSRLRIREIIDEACPVRDVAELTHGQVIEVLVANRLTSPSPLVHVQQWARTWAVAEAFGVDPALLNDDRIGRALDAIAPHLDHLVGSIGLRAIQTFGLDVARMHWDMTSMSLHGDFPRAEEGYPAPKFGHPKDRRPDPKQIQAGIAVTGDGAVPLFHRAFDGGVREVGQVIGTMKALQQLACRRRLLMIGDSKLISYANLAAIDGERVGFIAPASKTYVGVEVLRSLDLSAAAPVDYVAARDAGKTPDRRGSWHVIEDAMSLAGPRKGDAVLNLRRVFVHSSARAVAAYLRTEVGTDPVTGKPTLAWYFDQEAVDAEAAADGWYALLTNLDPAQADAEQVLRLYKGQEAVERRYSAFKGPLAVAALYLKNNRRYRRADHRHLPGPAHLLPGRTPGTARLGRAERHQGRGPVRRPARDPHRPAHLRCPGWHPDHLGYRPVTTGHSSAHRSPDPPSRPP
jgi:hypothetical protein